jgi:hypothetical protein
VTESTTAGAPGERAAPERFKVEWQGFVEAYSRQEHAAALGALGRWIEAWDECFWDRDFSPFSVAYWPDVEIVNRTRFFGVREHQGIEGFAGIRDEAAEVMSNFRFEVTGLRPAGSRFVGLGRIRARSRYAGIILRFPIAIVWTLRDGKIERIEAFTSQRRALASVGLKKP